MLRCSDKPTHDFTTNYFIPSVRTGMVLAVWLKTSVFGWQTFPELRLIYG